MARKGLLQKPVSVSPQELVLGLFGYPLPRLRAPDSSVPLGGWPHIGHPTRDVDVIADRFKNAKGPGNLVRAHLMLDGHTPEQDTWLHRRIHPRGGPDLVSRDPGDLRRFFRRIVVHPVDQLLPDGLAPYSSDFIAPGEGRFFGLTDGPGRLTGRIPDQVGLG